MQCYLINGQKRKDIKTSQKGQHFAGWAWTISNQTGRQSLKLKKGGVTYCCRILELGSATLNRSTRK